MTTLPCTTMMTIHMIATVAMRGATSRAMKMARLMAQATSMDTRPSATTCNSMTTTMMICGEQGLASSFPFYLSSYTSAFSFLAAHGNTHAFCRFRISLGHVHSSRVLPFSCITHILSMFLHNSRVPILKGGPYYYALIGI
jgi:hypothetical protein